MFLMSWYYAIVAIVIAAAIYKYIEYKGYGFLPTLTYSNYFLFILLQHDAMHKCGTSCRCLSLRLFVTLLYHIQKAIDIVILLSQPGSRHSSF